MNLDYLVSINILLLSNALLAAAAALAVLRCQRLLRRPANFHTQAASAPAASVPDDPQSEAVNQRILTLQKIADELLQKEKVLRQHEDSESPYESAVRMVKSGADADALTRTCGLNKGAAQLMVRLHARTH
ncbi:MAG: DUF2802 domain-containing protein [Woeseiaceae bacterium]